MRRGFTLIELLIVLVLISLVSAFVAPRITAPLDNLNLKTVSKKVAAAMRYSRSLAVSEKQSRVCFFDFDNRQVTVFPSSVLNAPDLGGLAELVRTGPAEIRYSLPEGVFIEKAVAGETDIHSGLFPVVFYANGSASGGDIYLSNAKDRTMQIRVDFITGMVSLTSGASAG